MERKKIDSELDVIRNLRNIEKMHPHKMLTYLFLFGNLLIFTYLLISLTIELALDSESVQNIELPRFFILGSFEILFTGYILNGIINAFLNEDNDLIRKKVFGLFLAGGVFFVFQSIAWLELIFQGVQFSSNVLGTYLYLISGFHMVSVLIGIGALAYYLYRTRNIHTDGVSKLIFFTSPYEKTKLEIVRIYWHYIVISWIFISTWLLFLI